VCVCVICDVSRSVLVGKNIASYYATCAAAAVGWGVLGQRWWRRATLTFDLDLDIDYLDLNDVIGLDLMPYLTLRG
jgi:hypothetical protein